MPPVSALNSVSPLQSSYYALFQFPSLTEPMNLEKPVKYGIIHHLLITRPSTYAHPRRLADCLQIARREPDDLLSQQMICPSSSAWSSPFPMMPKKEQGDRRPGGDYRALNYRTMPDHCLICMTSRPT